MDPKLPAARTPSALLAPGANKVFGNAAHAIIGQQSSLVLTQPPSAAKLLQVPSGSLVHGGSTLTGRTSQASHVQEEEEEEEPVPQAPVLKPLVFGLTEDLRYNHHKNQVKLFLENHNNQ